ncbi:MAG: hypothetical protein EAX96_11435 [Candidatus Lokiarchaeota archaeon]|nr:hypothetical protein [Candidatus Lokiarchaeota archaeon]
MNFEKLKALCEELIPSCVVFVNPLRPKSPENDDEFDSVFMYLPRFFDEKRIPIHLNIQNAYRVCFVETDWLELSKEIFVTRRKIGNQRINILCGMKFLDELKVLEGSIDKLTLELDTSYEKPKENRIIINVRMPKIYVGTKTGLCIRSFPLESDDQITFGFLESLRSFGQEMILGNMVTKNLESLESSKSSDEVKISNKIVEINSSIPLDENFNFSIFQFNPDDIYDEINKRTIDILKTFLRETLRRSNLLNEEFQNILDTYKKAFQKKFYGGASSELLINRAQKYGEEILVFPLLSEIFRELTRELNFPQDYYLFLLNSLNAHVIAVDHYNSKINDKNMLELEEGFIKKLTHYRSKISRIVSSKVINSALLDYGSQKCRIFPLQGLTKFGDFEVSPSIIEAHLAYVGTWELISENHHKIKLLIDTLEQGIIQLSDPIHIRPKIDKNGNRTTRFVTINEKTMKMPDFSLLDSKKRALLRNQIRKEMKNFLDEPTLTMIKILKYSLDELHLIMSF